MNTTDSDVAAIENHDGDRILFELAENGIIPLPTYIDGQPIVPRAWKPSLFRYSRVNSPRPPIEADLSNTTASRVIFDRDVDN